MSKNSIPVVIPAYEPDEQLLKLCEALHEAGMEDVLLVDDGSGPEYRKFFDEAEEKYHCKVLRHAVNQGKGRALKTAFNELLNRQEPVLGCITADSDGQHTPEDIRRCMQALEQHPQALVLGCREFTGDHVPFKSRFGNELTKKICSFLCGIKVSDTQTGLRGIPREFMRELISVQGERFEFETNMLIACKDRIDIHEIAIQTVYDSKEDHKTHFDPVKDSIRIYKIFGRMFFKYIVSSLSASLLDLLMFTLFCSLLRGHWSIYVAVATVAARVISAAYNYMINYKLVFKSQENHTASAIKYVCLAASQMLLSALLVTLGVNLLIGHVFSPAFPEVGIKIVVDGVLFFLSYYIQRKYIF